MLRRVTEAFALENGALKHRHGVIPLKKPRYQVAASAFIPQKTDGRRERYGSGSKGRSRNVRSKLRHPAAASASTTAATGTYMCMARRYARPTFFAR